jgi:hypothetical protein
MTTRRLRLALWQHRRSLKRQAAAQESAAEHLIVLAEILTAAGRPGSARRLVRIALRFRVKAICLTAEAEALTWCAGLPVNGTPCNRATPTGTVKSWVSPPRAKPSANS